MRERDKLTKAAQGQECTLRLFPYCNFNPETTVFAHANSSSKGMALKSENWWGCDCCSDCHAILDGQRKTELTELEIKEALLRAIHETLKNRIEKGLIKI